MHRSVENATPLIQHPVRDASLGSLAAFVGIGRDMRGYALRLILGRPKRCFNSGNKTNQSEDANHLELLSSGMDMIPTLESRA
ncbi:MAG: hypothetical protein FWD57_02785 [Polyangiaceae bacterium]|nr:hypothetical protein [Polyangiaceae bacterium]